MVVFGPLLHIRNGQLPRGVRRVETLLPASDLEQLKATLPTYKATSLLESLQQSVHLYRRRTEPNCSRLPLPCKGKRSKR